MNNLGQLSIWLGLISISISSISYLVSHTKEENAGARYLARASFMAFTACVSFAGILLMLYILGHEFAYSYVARYSSRDLPLIYLVSSFWAGQEGSFLLWVILGAWLGIFLMYKSDRQESSVMLIYNLINLFLVILLVKQNPFHEVPVPPLDGNGMNMLLQDPWMAIHPPIVFLGYAAYAIPFVYAVSSWWKRDYDGWIRPGLPWAIFAFVSLGAGIIIGGFWSYKVLGWGGYWGWDPVENASLLPWLAGTALVHGMILQYRQKRLRKTNFFLAVFSFILVIYCTFLTRSGILADFSVHSFTETGITGWLELFMGLLLFLFIWLLISRAKDVSVSGNGEIAIFSREFGIVAAMILLCLSCLVTGLGTSAPLITRIVGKASKVSTEFYVQTNLPLAVLLLFLLSFVPLMSFGKNNPSQLIKKLPWAAAGALLALAVAIWYGVPPFDVLLVAIFAGATAGMNLILAGQIMRRRFSISSGAIIHLGVGLMFLGFVASSQYDYSEKERFSQGVKGSALGYDITLSELQFLNYGKGERLEIPLDIKMGNNQFVAETDIYQERGAGGRIQRFVHPFIKRGLLSDLYISPVEYDPGEKPEPPNHIVIKRGKTINRHLYTLTFLGYDIPKGMGESGMHTMQIGAEVKVSYKDEEPVMLKPVLTVGQLGGPESRVRLPGPEEVFITLANINAEAKSITLVYEGIGAESQIEENNSNKRASVILDVSIKPGMTILWVGTFLMLLGGTVGVFRRVGR